jgi:hypothetical protein
MRSRILLSIPVIALALLLAALADKPPANPPVVREHTIEAALDVPAPVRKVMRRSCYDCHSYETRWPWYATLPPISRMIESDVKRARAALNFSEWTTGAGKTPGRAAGMLTAACAAVQQGIMPKKEYLYLHPGARPSADEVEALCSWSREQIARLRPARPAE